MPFRYACGPPGRRGGFATALGAAVLLLSLAGFARAQEPYQVPYFAIQNARIVPVAGPVIENGTIVIANGLIAAVGTNVEIPPEAWVIDGKGLTVYPGLIDSLTNLGLRTRPQQQQRGQQPSSPLQALRQQAQQPRSEGPEDRPGTTPWVNAADEIKTEDKRLENWRKAGFTTVVTAPDQGLFPGQAAVINTAGERTNGMVVKTPVALRVNFSGRGTYQGFPGSLMGVIAYLRQTFFDADHYGKAWSIYESGPNGLERPVYDQALQPIKDALEQGWPVLLPANQAREFPRAIEFAKEVGAQAVLYGGQEGYEVAGQLAAAGVPVLVDLDWPKKSRDADPEAEESLRVLRFRDRAPSTPAELHTAGVKFAFFSGDLTNPKDILKNAKKAVDKGLPAEAALRALTLSAAEIFGVADRLGSLEKGKIANLVVTDGDLFEEKTNVKMVFVDGRKFEVRAPKPDEEKEQAEEPPDTRGGEAGGQQ